jgi:hypothetical protein
MLLAKFSVKFSYFIEVLCHLGWLRLWHIENDIRVTLRQSAGDAEVCYDPAP